MGRRGAERDEIIVILPPERPELNPKAARLPEDLAQGLQEAIRRQRDRRAEN